MIVWSTVVHQNRNWNLFPSSDFAKDRKFKYLYGSTFLSVLERCVPSMQTDTHMNIFYIHACHTILWSTCLLCRHWKLCELRTEQVLLTLPGRPVQTASGWSAAQPGTWCTKTLLRFGVRVPGSLNDSSATSRFWSTVLGDQGRLHIKSSGFSRF